MFDFFGVICSEIAPIWLSAYLPPDEAGRVKSTVVHAGDRGEISQARMFEKLGQLVGVRADVVHDEWRDLVRIDTEMVALLAPAGRRGPLGLLTNSAGPFVRDILREHDLEPHFDAIIVSSEVGLAKPGVAIYRLILAHLGLSASRAVMVDDTPANVAGARAAGMQALLFTSSSECRQRLGL